jgi:imidazoleglycerol phosphate dehydratase HisB
VHVSALNGHADHHSDEARGQTAAEFLRLAAKTVEA